MYRLKNVALLILCVFGACQSQRSVYNFAVYGEHKGQAAQGMAVYEDRAYLLNNTGYCRVFDLSTNSLIYEFPLASAEKTNHANCASFGKEFVNNNHIPVLYVSECSYPYRCYVENIQEGKAELVQTIQVYKNGKPELVHDWIVDVCGSFLYTFSRLGVRDTHGNIVHSILKYRNKVILSEKDVLEKFDISFLSMGQGGMVQGRYMYLPVGLSHDNDEKRPDSQRAIVVVDLLKRKIKRMIDISNIVYDEPEDIAFYKGKVLLFCGQKGGLMILDIKM